VARRSNSRRWAIKNRRLPDFFERFGRLSASDRAAAKKAFLLFIRNPRHPSLRLHALRDNAKGRHRKGSLSVSVTKTLRAVYVVNDGVNDWYWIGTHAEYDAFTGVK
jgi:hypothetical protein